MASPPFLLVSHDTVDPTDSEDRVPRTAYRAPSLFVLVKEETSQSYGRAKKIRAIGWCLLVSGESIVTRIVPFATDRLLGNTPYLSQRGSYQVGRIGQKKKRENRFDAPDSVTFERSWPSSKVDSVIL